MDKSSGNKTLLWVYVALCLFLVTPVHAHDASSETDDVPSESYVSVEENLREMDKDKDGMVSVQEVRAALEVRHGEGYEQVLLSDMEASASGRSCSTPFSQNFY
jgi:hypothetical protein